MSDLHSIIHYLDNFLVIGPSGSRVCHTLLAMLQHVFELFGVLLAAEKTEGPVTVLKFLGIVTVGMECQLQLDKLEDLLGVVPVALGSKKKQKLNFVYRIMPMGGIFCRRLATATSGIRALNRYIRLTKVHRDNLKVWHLFLENYNGRSLWMEAMVLNCELDLYTDAAGAVGYGAFFSGLVKCRLMAGFLA